VSTEEILPEGWVWTTLGNIAMVNPSTDVSILPASTLVSFVPMAAVEAGTGRMDSSIVRELDKVKKGYTAFQESDVLFAKITPCMENGKFAVAQLLSSSIGFGSTEFHVLRPEDGINPHLIYYYLSQGAFRQLARVGMTGSAGQLRVPATFLRDASYPLASTNEQSRIVAAIEQQFTRLDSAVASLRSAKARAKQYRASLLKSAVEGELTKEWRTTHPVSETGAQLLQRILAERHKRWEEAEMAKMREKGITPKDDKWKEGYKEPQKPDVEHLPDLPEDWCWATVEQVADIGTGATPLRSRAEYYEGGTIPWVTSGSVNNDFIVSAEEFITEKVLVETNAKIFPVGSLILAMYGEGKTRGKISELKVEVATNQACAAIVFRPFSFLCQPYVKIFLISNYLAIRAFAVGGVQPNLNLTVVKETAIPLPPLSEQTQIVAEVEAKLSNITQLETTIEADLKRAEHERQSILHEAFAGRLVPQDPNDEPANVLLERIRAERKRREAAEQAVKADRKAEHMDGIRRRRANKSANGQLSVGLYEKLVEAGQSLPPDNLFKRVGLQTDEQPDSTRVFYRELQTDEQDELIEVTRPNDTLVLLEALEPYEVQDTLSNIGEAGEEEMSNSEDVEQLENVHTQELPTLWDTNF